MAALIQLIDICKYYELEAATVKAVDGISLEVNRGEFLSIVGQSGSGKSTCMNIIGCLDVPSSGKYILAGEDISRLSSNKLAEIRNKKLGFIFQQYNLLPKLSILENVELPLAYSGVPVRERKERALRVLEKLGIADKYLNYPKQLSGGQQQRVSIARALVGRPELILADEPTGALDSKTGREVLALLQELNSEGNTIILITHDNSIAEEAHRIVRLADGKIIEEVCK